MQAERARLKRLQRLEKVRAIAKQAAAGESARAESTLAQLEALASRTRRMADEYRARTDFRDGLELRQLGQFVSGLNAITATTSGDALNARALADRKQLELAQAERSRAAVEDRAKAGAAALARRSQPQALGGRKAVGTPLE